MQDLSSSLWENQIRKPTADPYYVCFSSNPEVKSNTVFFRLDNFKMYELQQPEMELHAGWEF